MASRTPRRRRAPAHRRPDRLTDPVLGRRRNRHWLEAHAASLDPAERRFWRNAVVTANLPLVRSIAARLAATSGLPFDDLVQVGSLGLLRAVEAFDAARGVNLSSFAVPYVRGAMRHELRDRQSLVRLPRRLWDLRQREGRLQEDQRRRGLPPLRGEALLAALACGPETLREALTLGTAGAVRSLDAPATACREGSAAGDTLLDRLADPASLASGTAARDDQREEERRPASAERLWLRRALTALDPLERHLLEGRHGAGCSWVELGAALGIPPRQAQRRCEAVIARLQRAATAWLEEEGGESLMAG
jgi:RNA polymerase sigma-B factor